MDQMLLNHPRLTVRVRTGSEGPEHDPYAYTKLHVVTPLSDVTLHEGLAEYLEYTVPKGTLRIVADSKFLREFVFPVMTGYTVEQLERIHRKLRSRCRNCGGQRFPGGLVRRVGIAQHREGRVDACVRSGGR